MPRKKTDIDKEQVLSMLRMNMQVTDIALHFKVDRNTLYYRFKSWKIKPHRERFDHDFFEIIDNEKKAYWLGFIMADGCVSVSQSPKVQVRIKESDDNHLLKWHDAIRSNQRLSYGSGAVSSAHYSSKLCEDLCKMGCTPRKSLTLKFPSLLPELYNHFMRGYFDGDGCFSWHNKKQSTHQIRFTLIGTKGFLESTRKILSTKTNTVIQSKLIPKGKAFALSINGNLKVNKVVKWMYDGHTICLSRKKEIINAVL